MDIRRGVFIPNLVTMGNGICGFSALITILKIQNVESAQGSLGADQLKLFAAAAWLILLGMIFDAFDGQIARLSGRTSDLGAQLDSLCDLVTFGIAPAALVIRMNMAFNMMVYQGIWGKVVWFFCLAYFLGAILRLARFNAENDHDESAHLCFKGLPSPAAAGCVASLVIFYSYIQNFSKRELQWLGNIFREDSIKAVFEYIPLMLPVLMLILGYIMVASRLKYSHMAGRLLNHRQSFEFFVSLVFFIILAAVIPEVILPIVFIGYMLYAPIAALLGKLFGRRGGKAERIEPVAKDEEIEDFLPESHLDERHL